MTVIKVARALIVDRRLDAGNLIALILGVGEKEDRACFSQPCVSGQQ